MLNLVRGKRSFCCRLGHEASLVKFDPSGERFFMVVNSKVGVHQSEDAKLLLELDNCSHKRILCASPGDVRFSLYLYISLSLYSNLSSSTCV